jgi:hypothetical protein
MALNVDSIGAQYDEGIALVDFLGRHRIAFYSAESSYFSDLTEEQMNELDALFGADFSRFGFWYYFSLNEGCGRTFSFPSKRGSADGVSPPAAG